MLSQFKFELKNIDKSSKARRGLITTAHGTIQTPVFMPVGTQGSVKSLSPNELVDTGSQIILGNTYHLYLRPGTELLRQAGGLHKFANWQKPMLTDSGGYQVFSLSGLRKIHDDGVRFQSHIDGSYHDFTPENVMEMQRLIGADIIMAFDECPPHDADENYVAQSNDTTVKWAQRCKKAWQENPPEYGYDQALFGIVQGGTFEGLRRQSAQQLVELDLPGYSIGGLSVGEPAPAMYAMTEVATEILPKDKPRYLMGVGKPENLVEAVNLGVDMFDCVMPTRNGRKGQAFVWQGTLNLKNAKFTDDFTPIDEQCRCYACKNFSRAYMRHLLRANELFVMRLISLHNLQFYHDLMAAMREAIEKNEFSQWRKSFYGNRWKVKS
ncbi:MAG: tRNA guanosine(34) transglycosylase Tgt [Calditrichaeota bacterium]|nr:MAG: tRNA guanosine(34) transglycosylase Tgt [Calditrichota bacterium]